MSDRIKKNEYIDLSTLEVVPVTKDEEAAWNKLVGTHHYLGFNCLVGETIKYKVLLNNDWVACVGWGAAALKNLSRDTWIGWAPERKWKRLKYIANNMRFLIFPWIKIKNLASKILAVNLNRLANDWSEIHGHPVVLAETFVDQERFRGTCYVAAGWTKLGETKGYRKNGGKYYFHGKPKTIFIKPLMKETKTLLAEDFLDPKLNNKEGLLNINTIDMKEMFARLGEGTDSRKKRGIRHKADSILAMSVCATLSGCKGFTAIGEWAAQLDQDLLQRFNARYDGEKACYVAPSEPTFRRMLQSADGGKVDEIIGSWLMQKCDSDVISFDGKTIRGSADGEKKAVHLVSAVMQKEGVIVAQQAVNSKSNEITAVEPLLATLDIKGKIITGDAMHTQTKLAHYLKKTMHTSYSQQKAIKQIF